MSGAFMLDTEMFSWIQDDPEALAAFVSPGRRLLVLITHVQRDQVSAATDEGVSERVAMLDFTTEVETTGAGWDVSRWDEALFGTDADNAVIASVTGEDSQPPNRLSERGGRPDRRDGPRTWSRAGHEGPPVREACPRRGRAGV